MKYLGILAKGIPTLLLVGASIGPLSAQAVKPTPAQPQPTGRDSYDPMAHGNRTGPPKGIVEATLAGVNPQGKDYGGGLADWRNEVFENTLQAFYFWSLIGTSLALGVSVMGNSRLLRQREHRLTVSADIVAQLYHANRRHRPISRNRWPRNPVIIL